MEIHVNTLSNVSYIDKSSLLNKFLFVHLVTGEKMYVNNTCKFLIYLEEEQIYRFCKLIPEYAEVLKIIYLNKEIIKKKRNPMC